MQLAPPLIAASGRPALAAHDRRGGYPTFGRCTPCLHELPHFCEFATGALEPRARIPKGRSLRNHQIGDLPLVGGVINQQAITLRHGAEEASNFGLHLSRLWRTIAGNSRYEGLGSCRHAERQQKMDSIHAEIRSGRRLDAPEHFPLQKMRPRACCASVSGLWQCPHFGPSSRAFRVLDFLERAIRGRLPPTFIAPAELYDCPPVYGLRATVIGSPLPFQEDV